LVQANGRVLTRQALMARAMGPGVTVTERTIDVHITSIRKKLDRQAGMIKTVRGVGYRATPEPADASESETESEALSN
jgi:DNA-binding response OmpR family regulator